jgi:outer membrane immunogenic protein
MKKFGLALIASAISFGPAIAADMAVKARPAPAPIAAVYNWGGFYVGINGGGGSSHKCWDLLNNSGVVVNPAISEGCHDATGGTVGGQIGYRWQAANWVFGLEAQGNWADFGGSNPSLASALVAGTPLLNNHTKIDAFGLFTGQIGYAFNNVLIYVKGGGAVVNDKYSQTITAAGAVAFALPAGATVAAGSETRWGGAVGAGIEFGFAPGWSVALEYDHLFMGGKNVSFNALPPFPALPPSTRRISQDVDIGMVRVNYTFGGPVVARY